MDDPDDTIDIDRALLLQVVKSQKYDVAVKKEVPVMTAEWVDQVWERGRHDNVHAVDPQFARYRCPALRGLAISVSQLNRKDKELLRKSIESHGGTYSPALDMDSTTILIAARPDGDKYRYARKWKIPCLSLDWVFDSIEKGHCLPTDKYRVDAAPDSASGAAGSTDRASTPTKADVTPAGLSEVSMCSTILRPQDETITSKVNETAASVTLNNSMFGPAARTVEQLIDQLLDLPRVRKAGAFLGGEGFECRIFLSGFSESQQEHLRRCIQSAGAHRYDVRMCPVENDEVGNQSLGFQDEPADPVREPRDRGPFGEEDRPRRWCGRWGPAGSGSPADVAGSGTPAPRGDPAMADRKHADGPAGAGGGLPGQDLVGPPGKRQ